MGFKDILVGLDSGRAVCGRIEVAAGLAVRDGAHLIGLHTGGIGQPTQGRGYFDQVFFDQLYQEFATKQRVEAEVARALFEEIAGRYGVSAEWRSAPGYPSEAAALHGRYADLIVLGQLDPDDPQSPLSLPHPEEVALAVGRPVLVVPYAGEFAAIGRHVLIGWDASREATRAVNDALPILMDAASVTVLVIDPAQGYGGHGEVPGADIALHLARHGVKARVEATISGGIGAGNALLSRASDLEADLLVMGAYGHSRMRELLLGGATRTVIESMTLPVLMAH